MPIQIDACLIVDNVKIFTQKYCSYPNSLFWRSAVFFNKVVAFVRATMEGGDRLLISLSEKVIGLCIQDKITKKELEGCLGRPKKI